MLAHPEIPSCENCQRWIYDQNQQWKPLLRGGELQPRNGLPTPCMSAGNCPKGNSPTEGRQRELNERNAQAVECFQECRAVGIPDEWRADPLFRENMATIDGIYRSAERVQLARAIVQESLPFLIAKK